MLVLALVLGTSVMAGAGVEARAESDEGAGTEERVASQPPPAAPLNLDPAEAGTLAGDLVGAIARPELEPRVVEATYTGAPGQAAVFTTARQEFPRSGNQYAVLSTGPAAQIPGVATTFLSVDMGGVHVPGGSPDGLDAFDVATLTVRLDLDGLDPDDEPRLVFRYKFCSEEPPSFWGSGFQDYFTANVRDAQGQHLQNIALLPNGQPFTIDNARPFMNQVTGSSTSPQPPFPAPNDVVFNACTGIHTTDFDLTGHLDGEIELELQIGDVLDAVYDSAVFIDGLEVHAGPLPDFRVERVEFNQASQPLEDGQTVAAQRLATRKTTAVRVYVVGEDNEEDPQQVSAELHLLRGGVPVAGSPFAPLPQRIAPVEEPSRLARGADDRATETLEFRIPGTATTQPGGYQFFVVVDPDNEVDEADPTNNRFPDQGFETVTFEDRGFLDVLRVHVTTVDGDGNEVDTFDGDDWSKLASQMSYTRAILPPSVRWTTPQSLEWNLDGPTGWWLWSQPGGDLSTTEGRSALFSEILDILGDTGADTVMAMLPRTTALGANGWGYVGSPGGLVKTAQNSTLVHEISHNMLPPSTFDPPDTDHDPTNSGEDGYDTRFRRLMVNKANILHTGSDDPWVSPISYAALFDNNELTGMGASALSAGAAVSAQQSSQALRVVGWIADDGELRLRPIHTVPATTFTSHDPSGAYVVELLGAGGEVLDSLRFSPPAMPVHGGPLTPGPFLLHLPRPAGLASIAFASLEAGEAEVLGTVPVSEHPPTVTVSAPSGGEDITGMFTIEWEGSDPDGDPLAYTLRYTPDDGDSWHVLATNLTSTSYQWDTSTVPGGTVARIEVRATDGVNSGWDRSGTFSVATKPPTATIVAPDSGDTLALGEPADLVGMAEDPEDGELTGPALVWSSDVDGVLGTGEVVTTTELSEGVHTITLAATDSEGNTATDAITLTVTDTTPPPPTGVEAVPGDGQVTLHWQASASEFVTGYRVYWGTNSGVYGADGDAGAATSRTISNLANDTTYFFAVTAYDAFGNESAPSEEVEATPGPVAVTVPFSVRPGGCPNPLIVHGGPGARPAAVVPAAILGTADLDVGDIVPESLEVAGVAPLRWGVEDVAAPYSGTISDPPDRHDCTDAGPDGVDDLVVHLDASALAAALGDVAHHDVVVVQVTGELLDGTQLTGQDVVWILRPGG